MKGIKMVKNTKKEVKKEKEISQEELLKEEIKKLNEDILRAAAEVQNTKKRSENEIKLRTENAISSFAKSIIPVLDALNKSLNLFEANYKEQEITNETKQLLEGLKLVQKSFLTSLEQQGIKQIESIGKIFDPSLHLVVQQIENPKEKSGTILSEIQTGYTLNGKVIKEAMVIVAK